MQDSIDLSFTETFKEARQHHENDELDECIEKSRALLAEPAIPRSLRIKTLLLLGSTLGDWEEAEDCRVRADSLWRDTRRWQPAGFDVGFDKAMADLREGLDKLASVIREEQSKDYDAEEERDWLVEEDDVKVAEAKANAQDEQGNIVALQAEGEVGNDVDGEAKDVSWATSGGVGEASYHHGRHSLEDEVCRDCDTHCRVGHTEVCSDLVQGWEVYAAGHGREPGGKRSGEDDRSLLSDGED